MSSIFEAGFREFNRALQAGGSSTDKIVDECRRAMRVAQTRLRRVQRLLRLPGLPRDELGRMFLCIRRTGPDFAFKNMHFIMAIKLGDNAELGAKIDNVEFFSAYCEANRTFRNLNQAFPVLRISVWPSSRTRSAGAVMIDLTPELKVSSTEPCESLSCEPACKHVPSAESISPSCMRVYSVSDVGSKLTSEVRS